MKARTIHPRPRAAQEAVLVIGLDRVIETTRREVLRSARRRRSAQRRRTRRLVGRLLEAAVTGAVVLLAALLLHWLGISNIRGLEPVRPAPATEAAGCRVGKDHALLIGTDVYDRWPKLNNPVGDVQALGAVLRQRYGYDVKVEANPALDQVVRALQKYSAEMTYGPDDQLFIFVAGHGDFDRGTREGFIVARDSRRNDPARTSYLATSRLRDLAEKIRCRHVLLVMDVCFGGAIDFGVATAERGSPLDFEVSRAERIARKLKRRTCRYLTSGGRVTVSDGCPGQHSPFAARFLEALREGGDSQGIVTLTALRHHLEHGKLEPQCGALTGDEAGGDFLFIAKGDGR